MAVAVHEGPYSFVKAVSRVLALIATLSMLTERMRAGEDMNDVVKQILEIAGIAFASFVAGGGAVKFLSRAASDAKSDTIRLLDTQKQDLQDRLSSLSAAKDGAYKHTSNLEKDNAKLRADLGVAVAASPQAGQLGAQLQSLDEMKKRVAKYDELRDALTGNEDELWRFRGITQPENFEARMRTSRLKVITVANLKGGVGKTTLVANLAAYFAAKGKRVLAIDFDYQGSLTRMVMLGCNLPLNSEILADTLLKGNASGQWLADSARELGATLPGARLVTCGHTFDRFENRVLMQWLLGETEDDVRFRLAKILLDERVQKDFDIVLIDAPPRLTMGAVNALCASHAMIVPTVLDRLSVDAVQRFVGRANSVFRPLNPALEHVGIVGTITKMNKRNRNEQDAFDVAKRGLAQWHGKSHVFERSIPHLNALARAAGAEIGYLGREREDVKPIFDVLGQEISEKFGL
jgi:cellulose biosynthesis protein BcsQ